MRYFGYFRLTQLGVAFVLYCLCLARASAEEIRVINAGVGGQNSRDLLARIDKDVLQHRPDLVVLMVGSNDVLNSGNAIPLPEYEKNLETLAKRIKEGGAELVIMTVLPCHVPYLLERHEKGFFGKGGPPERIAQANTAIRRLAKQYGIPVVEAHAIFSGIGEIGVSPESLLQNAANSGRRDGVHPTAEGYRILATAAFQTICAQGIRPKTIVCFGDSITFGAHVEGAGTATGKTYPAFLQRLMRAR